MAEVALGIYGLFSSAAAGATAAAASVGSALTSSLGLGGVAAGAAEAAGWVTTVSSASSGALSTLSGVLTAGSVLTSLAGGISNYSEAQLQASATELQTRDKVLRIKEEELQKVGAARVAFAASGVSLGTSAQVEDDLANQADYESRLTRASGRQEAATIRARGSNSLLTAAGDALGTAASYAIDLRRRG